MKTVALAGNPNCGKTTLFNKLTGSSQRVGNWPGVTIDRKEGKIKGLDDTIVVDLPGIYSLSPYSPEEIISRDFLMKDRPDVILNIVDASNIERNLYLTVQLLEMGIPTVIVLNMMDIAESKGFTFDIEGLERALGCKVIPATASKNKGMDAVKEAIRTIDIIPSDPVRFEKDVEDAITSIEPKITGIDPVLKRWAAIKALERDDLVSDNVTEDISDIIDNIEKKYDDCTESIITDQRYKSICSIVADTRKLKGETQKELLADKIDKIVTNRWLGLPIFALVMGLIYYISITTIGDWATSWVNDVLFGEIIIPGVSDWFAQMEVNEILSGLVVDGIISGVGAVLGFLPQMLVLFVLLVILEDCGYMSRIAFILDRIFRKFGLSGKSFIPVLVGMGCGVPGVMASRTIESDRDRRITAMTTTFIPCGAKLPVIALIAGALFGNSSLVALSIYLMGIVCILLSGIILKKWKSLSGDPAPFIMELPPYHVPSIFNIVSTSLQRGWAFVRNAGTIILLSTVIIWFLSSFGWSFEMVENTADSILASLGTAISFIFAPLGFGDWQFTVGTITGLVAKENIVATLGVLFDFAEVSESGEEIWSLFASMLTPVAGYSFLAFNMICAPCFAAIGAMHRELGTWKATGIAVLYQTALAYAVALIIYQIGSPLLGYGYSIPGIIFAVAALLVIVYLLVAKDPFRNGVEE